MNPQKPFNETDSLKHRKSICLLKTSITGNYCISHSKGQFTLWVGECNISKKKVLQQHSKDPVGISKTHRTQNSPTGQTSLISGKLGTVSSQTQIGRRPGSYIGSVGSKLIWCYLAACLGPVYWAQSGHLSSCFPLEEVKNWESSYGKRN
jgi:hypothetical protein